MIRLSGKIDPVRVAVHQSNKAAGGLRVWLVEQAGVLYEGEEVRMHGVSWTMTGELPHGPTLWIETSGEVLIFGVQRLSE